MKPAIFLAAMFVFLVATTADSCVVFFDDFNAGARPEWGHERGDWQVSSGAYYAPNYNWNYQPYSSITSYPDLTDFEVELDVNNLLSGGVALRSTYYGGYAPSGWPLNGVFLVTGGGPGTWDALYWVIIQNGIFGPDLNKVDGLGIRHQNVHLRITVEGDLYSAYVKGSPTPATTLTTNAFASGSVALFAGWSWDMPPYQTFDNVSLSPVPEPVTFVPFLGGMLTALAALGRRIRMTCRRV